MEKNQKKILMTVFLIILIIAFFINLSLLNPFLRYVLRYDISFRLIYNLVFFVWAIIFTIALWFPLVNGIGPRKASFVCIPFLLITLLLYLILSNGTLFLLSGIIFGIGFSGTLYLTCFLLVNNENKKRIVNCGITIIPCFFIIIFFLQLSYYGTGISVFTFEEETLTPIQVLTVRLSMMMTPIIALIMVIIIMLIVKDVEKQDQIY